MPSGCFFGGHVARQEPHASPKEHGETVGAGRKFCVRDAHARQVHCTTRAGAVTWMRVHDFEGLEDAGTYVADTGRRHTHSDRNVSCSSATEARRFK